ncbi:membrane-bound lytic murein transglycosylase MltF [Gallaecimonas pentaromativorans]|uniref:Membrane-bound lytic murein transglycosylase F n=1 Tax=Gallaecimonas pentaromativorans TaxID=584787 RepID=A0A3N1PL39_9GAMM|nr:membrane-bound lytic murein transglycosylase MltF [Gallaecimonas pentaromativorans]ROQ28588.1 membrane-bound lytic murein transglycosylase F [Gallaecimonas pentaromativorans]
MSKITPKWRGFWPALVLLLAACQDGGNPPAPEHSSQLESILERGELRVGTRYSDTTYFEAADGPAGLDYELAAMFADYLGVKLKIEPSYSLSDLFPKLEKGQYDLLAAGLSVTPERRAHFRFAPAYQAVSQKLVYKRGHRRPRDFDDLADGSLMVMAYSAHAERLAQVAKTHPDLKWTETSDMDADELLQQVLAGHLDYTVADSNNLALNRRFYPDLMVGFTVSDEQPVAWAFQKNNDDSLYAALIEFFGEMSQTGVIARLEEKYYGHVRTFDYVDTRSFMRAVDRKLPRYQANFEKYAGDFDWRLLAAMSYQESHWNPSATSVTGVRGLMMLTLDTADLLGINNRLDPAQSIRGGANYLHQLFDRMPESIPPDERVWFALAAYNVGEGHVLDARRITEKRGGDPNSWVDVKENLPLLRKKAWYSQTRHGYARGDEPVKYVDNIRRYYETLVWLQGQQVANTDNDEAKADDADDDSDQDPNDSVNENVTPKD